MSTLPTSVRHGVSYCCLMILSSLVQAQMVPTGPSAMDMLEVNGEWRMLHHTLDASQRGPIAWAHAVRSDLVSPPSDTSTLEAELRANWRFIRSNLLLSWSKPERDNQAIRTEVQELYANAETGGWQFSVGRKIISWDVGYSFRPNDVVQQEIRRSLLTVTPQGRPVIQAETFTSDTATSLAWVNPQAHDERNAPDSEGEEASLAVRWYSRSGSRDDYLFARWGQHTLLSVGAAVAWVVTDELELHASIRQSQKYLGWTNQPSDPFVNPWQVSVQRGGAQWLMGLNWTGSLQQGLLLEWWHDGSAPDNSAWTQWFGQNQSLRAAVVSPSLPEPLRTGLAGQLAWQASPLRSSQLRQDNLFVRASWQMDSWQFNWDTLYMPADHGKIGTLSAQWQADRWRLTLAWRRYGGPSMAITSQLPTRNDVLLAAVYTF